MTPWLLVAVVASVNLSICGQILFKLAMNQTNGDGLRMSKFVPVFASGIAAMALGFFLWLGLMSKFDLSYLYPFEGLDRLVLVLAAWIFLKEKMTPSLWLGVIMITVGIVLVSAS